MGGLPTQSGTHTLAVNPNNNDVYVYEGNSNTVDVFAPAQNLFGTITHDVTSVGGNVTALYETILGRAPDALGLENWTSLLNGGASTATVAQDFIG